MAMIIVVAVLFLIWFATAAAVTGPVMVIFFPGLFAVLFGVPLLGYHYLPIMFGAVVVVLERMVHRGLLAWDEEYQGEFEVWVVVVVVLILTL